VRPINGWAASLAVCLLATHAPATPTASPLLRASGVPAGVKLAASLDATLTSGTARVGERFTFSTVGAQRLGTLDVPAGSAGVGRIASVERGRKGHNGALGLQADYVRAPDGSIVWVDMDRKPLRAHYANRHVIPYVLPILPVIVPGALVTHTGDIVMDAGTRITVVTVAPRRTLPPLAGGATPDPSLTPVPGSASPSREG